MKSGYKAWAVEAHVATSPCYVFTRKFKEEATARRCFEALCKELKEPVYEARLWCSWTLIDVVSIRE